MPTEPIAAFLDRLRDSRLLETSQLAQLPPDRLRFADAAALGQELVRRGWLTPYQLDELLHGSGRRLVLGNYRLLERLGKGGMGEVFKARHRLLDRVDAVKVIRRDHLDCHEAVQRFRREARAAARLAHPNVVTVYDTEQDGDTHFIAMEYVAG